MRKIRFSANLIVLLLADAILIFLAYLFAHIIRFEFAIPEIQILNLKHSIIPLLLVKLTAFYVFDLYKGMWRYTSINELVGVIKAVLISSAAIIIMVLMISHFQGYSRSIFVIDAGLTLFFVAGIRLSIRLVLTGNLPFLPINSKANGHCKYATSNARKRLLIVGAGDAGEKVLREIAEHPNGIKAVGLIDDKKEKIGRKIHGVPVLGTIDDLENFANCTTVDEIVVAIPSATGAQMRRIFEKCELAKLPFKTLPGLGEIIDGKVSIKEIRDISYRDLLGRQPVRLENDKILELIKDKTVLVTGAGGSIGSELCRQICVYRPQTIILLDSNERNMYKIQTDFNHLNPRLQHKAVIGQVQDKWLMRQLFNKYSPQVVFHAAAYKHVPLMEENPWEAVNTNVKGTSTVVRESIRSGVERFVLVSTDKAVRPTNVMGATKRITEKIMQACNPGATKLMAVRFGNVIGSSGSVVPLFLKQIKRGGPVTVTHPEVTRFFMTIEEATQLILQAATMGAGGEIFILKMGTPVKILDMAQDLIRLAGKDPGRDIDIQFTGLRPGEKLYEELITEGEGIVPTGHEEIVVLRNGHKDCRIDWLQTKIEELSVVSRGHQAVLIKQKIQEIVPEYKSSAYRAVV